MTKKQKNAQSGASSDLFGLDEFGMRGDVNPLWGAVAGTGLGTLAAIGARQASKDESSKVNKYSEAIGFAVGGGVSAAMLISKSTRAAGFTGLAAAFLNNGLRQLEKMMVKKTAATTTPDAGTGGVVIEPTQVISGAGSQMGLVDIEPTTVLMGPGNATVGNYHEGQRQDMPQLVAGIGAANQRMKEMGGPPLSAYAAQWGATHFSGRS